MVCRRKVAHEIDVRSPREFLRILGPADDEAEVRAIARRRQEQAVDADLTVCRIGAEIGEVACKFRPGDTRPVLIGIDMTVEWLGTARPETGAQLLQRGAAGIA